MARARSWGCQVGAPDPEDDKRRRASGNRERRKGARALFRTVDAKSNFAPPSENSTWYQIESEDLDNGDEDHEDDSVGVVTPWSYPTLTEDLPSDIIEQVQAKVRCGQYRDSEQSEDWVGYALGPICGLDPEVKGQRKKLKRLIREWVENGVLRKVTGRDRSRKPRGFIAVPGYEKNVPGYEEEKEEDEYE